MPSLTERRAEFVYDGARLAAIASQAPVIPVPWAERELSFQQQIAVRWPSGGAAQCANGRHPTCRWKGCSCYCHVLGKYEIGGPK